MNPPDTTQIASVSDPSPLLVVELKNSHAACKEAVVDGVLNILTARLSGKGDFGKELYRGKPRSSLATAFLLPMPKSEREGDEEASPIQISAHGLDFQVKSIAADTEIVVSVKGCAYVRIFPNEKEVAYDGPCQPNFPIKPEIKKELNLRIRVLLNELRAKLGKGYFKTKEWADRSIAIRKQVHESMGLPFQDIEDATPMASGLSSEGVSESEPSFALLSEDILSPEDPKEVAADMTIRGSAALPDTMVAPVPPPQKWMRVELELPSFAFKIDNFQDVVGHASHALTTAVAKQLLAWSMDPDPIAGGKHWGFRHGTRVMPSSLRNWNEFLDTIRATQQQPVLPQIKLKWHIQVHDDPLDSTRKNIHLALENWSDEPGQSVFKETEESLFQVSISLTIPASAHVSLNLDRVKPSYRYQQYLSYPALGFNGGVASVANDETVFLSTTWSPRYVQPRIVPTELGEYGLVANIEALSLDDCLPKLIPLVTAYESWLADVENLHFESGLEASDIEHINSERMKFKEDLVAWRKEKGAIERGLDILQKSSEHWSGPGPQSDPKGVPFEAWICMNATMAEVAKRKGYADWRLFQLAFIVANIPAFATRIPAFHDFYDAETAEYANASMVLYFSTGGGKSEAFLGLLVFVLFLDRLRGKERGVSAMLRYPLRLLTLQQAQRTAKTLSCAEVVRMDRKHSGEPFSLGFWVGNSNTPNHLSDPDLQDGVPTIKEAPLAAEPKLKQKQTYKIALERWNKLPSCPFCSRDTALRRFDSIGGALGHTCLNETKGKDGCKWNLAHAQVTPLPFYIVDEDIYSFAPSVLLGTVDKMAMLGHSAGTIRKFYGLFGFAPWWDPATGRTHIPNWKELKEGPGSQYRTQFPAYENGDNRFFDPFPSLMIQDEAHLLDESLGTFAGLFETAFEAALNDLSPLLETSQTFEPGGSKRRRIKVIAASATVSDPERQMRSLYQRNQTIQFPYPGPSLYESFYARPQSPDQSLFDTERLKLPENDVEARSHWARVYQSILTNGRTHTVTMVTTLASFHLTITSLFERLKSGVLEQQEAARNELLSHLSRGPLWEQHTRLLTAISPAELLTLIDLHRIALTYVTNKKGGDQLIDAERMEFEALHKRSGYDDHKLSSELITGAVDASKIQAVVRWAERKPKAKQPFFDLNNTLRSIIATSAVSHGVDVEEFNSMFFAGMPSDIAEYIQASSRVGRTHVGFCILVPTPQRARDRYIVEVHDIFHRFLERMIQPASVDRWAENALQRVLPSFVQTYLCGVRAIQDFATAADKENVPTYAMTGEVSKLLNGSNSQAEKIALAVFLKEAFGLKPGFSPEGAVYYRDMAAGEVNEISKDLLEPIFKNARLSHFFEQRNKRIPPMTSLRDVDEPGHIVPSGREPNGTHKLDAEILAKSLRFIRGGVGADTDTSIPKSRDIQ